MGDPNSPEEKTTSATAEASSSSSSSSTADIDADTTTRKRTREETTTNDDGPLDITSTNVAKAPKINPAFDDVFWDADDSENDDEARIRDDDESSSNPLIREAETTLEVPGNGGTYTFHLQLLEFNEGLPGVREVSVKVYFDKSEKEDQKPSAKNDNEESGQEVGYLTGFLLPRPVPQADDIEAEELPTFYDMAQAVSDELAEVTTLLCNSQGRVTKLRDPGRPSATTPEQSFYTKGGFLQVYALEVEGPDHAGTCDLGLHLVAQTLEFLQDEWSLAVMVPCLLGVNGMRWPEFHNRLKIDPSAPDHSLEQTEGLKQAHVAIKRHFSRLGFRQAGRNSEQHHVFYLPASDFVASPTAWKSKQDVQALDIFVAPDPYEPTGVNAELHTLLQDQDPTESLDLTLIRKLLVQQGASLHGSRALFLAAAQDSVPWMEGLLQVACEGMREPKPLLFVNESDENGNTPLHVAAMMMHLDVIQYLLDKGASKSDQNDKQHTPFDTLQESIESMFTGEDREDDEEDGATAEARELAKRCEALLKE